ncbi:MAG: T9SS type A sorting domain-containing protein [candidate division WOR-3 bacterium]|nr:T9SS type A sorting domain-containing protein [candidate division WOR-3 bacterium]MDH5683775.1 T9SS type A sorting domain-containing protein [candidate division WOR-3 bacterium]
MQYSRVVTYLFLICLNINISMAFGHMSTTEKEEDLPFNAEAVIERVKLNRQKKFQNPYSEIRNFNSNLLDFDSKISRSAHQLQGDEFLIDTGIVYTSAPDDQESPCVAFDGANYLIVWTDERGGYSDIYGARLSRAGVLLDSAGIAIAIAANWQWHPSVVFGGTNYFVTWQDYRNGNYDIYGTRVNQAGGVLDPNGIAISTAAGDQGSAAVAFDGTNYFVVWDDGNNIYGARVNQTGIVLDPNSIAISTAGFWQKHPSVAFDGTNYLVVWQDYRHLSYDIYGARVNQAGVVLDQYGIAISNANYYQDWPSVTFGDTNYLVVWQELRSGYPSLCGSRINQAGIVLDPNGIPIPALYGYNQQNSSIAFDGTNYLVVWQAWFVYSYDIYGARVNQSGVVLDQYGFAISTAVNDQRTPFVVFDEINYLIVWSDLRSDSFYDIYATWVNRSGTVLDSIGIINSIAANDQRCPFGAFDGTNYLVVWSDLRSSSSYDIYSTRISQTGIILDPISIAISTAVNRQWNPAIAFDGINYLVVWEDYRNSDTADIFGARVSQTGIVLDPSGFAISTAVGNQCFPILDFDGINYLVIWQDSRNGFNDIYGARVNRTGVVLDPNGIAISTASSDQVYPSVAFDSANYLVVWQDLRHGADDIYGARVSQTGVVLDPNGIVISLESFSQLYPNVAFDGTNYLVVWQGQRSSSSYKIYGARINQAGTVLDSVGFRISTGDGAFPSLTFDGTNYIVGWQDRRSDSDIYGAKVNTSGSLTRSFPISTQKGAQISPALASGAVNQTLTIYSGWTDIEQGRNYNAMRIWGKFYSDIDVGVTQIIAPLGTLDSGTIVTPQAKVKNFGVDSVSFPITLRIGAFYTNSQIVNKLAPGDSTVTSFALWTAVQRGSNTIKCTTALTGDLNPVNDALSDSVTVQVLDVGISSILAPTGIIDSGATVVPRVKVKNFGTVSTAFPIYFRIYFADTLLNKNRELNLNSRKYSNFNRSLNTTSDNFLKSSSKLDSIINPVYEDSIWVSLSSGDSIIRDFRHWTASQIGDHATKYTVKCTTALISDQNQANDALSDSIIVGVRDVGVTQIIVPSGTIDSGTVVTPQAKVKNFGNIPTSFWAIFRIGAFYADVANVPNLDPNDSATISFSTWIVLQRGTHATKCTTICNGDLNSINNALSDSVKVEVRDVGVARIIAPSGIIDSGTVVTPKTRVKNFGNTPASFWVFFKIGTFYADVANVSNLNPNDTFSVSFRLWTASQNGTHITKCSTALIGDQNPVNNSLRGFVTVGRLDVGVTTILSPSSVIDSGSTVTPMVKVKNYGTTEASFPVWFKIQSDTELVRQSFKVAYGKTNLTKAVMSYSKDTKSDAVLSPDQIYEDSVWLTLAPEDSIITVFDQWTATIPDTYRLQSFTNLSGDMNPANDTAYGSLIVMRPSHDVGVVNILAPTDTVDSSAIVIPRAVVQNFGTISELFPIRFNIGDFYTDDTVISLGVGLIDTIEFMPWMAIQIGTHMTKCTTLLTGDSNPTNNFLIDSVIVQPRPGIAEPSNFQLLPKSFVLENCLPNPFIARTIIRYALPKKCRINLDIYNSSGILVQTLKTGDENAGYYKLIWDGTNAKGNKAAKGVYFYRLETDGFTSTKKMVKH